ncbi:MAG: FecR domain-containing protein [Armatimonadetes bacterium]|nr:FecR domain-containing protein [Armatimonadota bacterium]
MEKKELRDLMFLWINGLKQVFCPRVFITLWGIVLLCCSNNAVLAQADFTREKEALEPIREMVGAKKIREYPGGLGDKPSYLTLGGVEKMGEEGRPKVTLYRSPDPGKLLRQYATAGLSSFLESKWSEGDFLGFRRRDHVGWIEKVAETQFLKEREVFHTEGGIKVLFPGYLLVIEVLATSKKVGPNHDQAEAILQAAYQSMVKHGLIGGDARKPVTLQPTSIMPTATEIPCAVRADSGNLEIRYRDTEEWVTIPKNALVRIGDTVRFKEMGRACLTFPDGTVFRIKSKTELTLQNERVEIKTGEVNLTIIKQVKNFQIETPIGTFVVRGTVFSVEVADGGQTTVKVFEGSVQATSTTTKQSATITAGQVITVTATGMETIGAFDAAAEKARWDREIPLPRSSK